MNSTDTALQCAFREECRHLSWLHVKRKRRENGPWVPGKFCFLDIRIHRSTRRVAMLAGALRDVELNGSYPSLPNPPVE